MNQRRTQKSVENVMQNQTSTKTLLVITAVCLLAIISRFVLIEWPNFKPVAAVAIFLGFYCRDQRLAVGAVLGLMLVSDLFLGFYSPFLMGAVYASIAIACGLGTVLGRRLQKSNSIGSRIGTVSVAAIVAAVVFYLTTNIAVVFASPWYPNSISGILQSLVAGLPFFKYTLAGNLMFTVGIFAAYYWLASLRVPKQVGDLAALKKASI